MLSVHTKITVSSFSGDLSGIIRETYERSGIEGGSVRTAGIGTLSVVYHKKKIVARMFIPNVLSSSDYNMKYTKGELPKITIPAIAKTSTKGGPEKAFGRMLKKRLQQLFRAYGLNGDVKLTNDKGNIRIYYKRFNYLGWVAFPATVKNI